MMKFFRKHNKKLLAVLMALLMIVFLGGTAFESWMRPDPNYVIAKYRFGKISTADRARTQFTTELLSAMFLRWSMPLENMPEPLTVLDWMLLLNESRDFGTVRDATAVRTMVSDEKLRERITKVAYAQHVRPEQLVDAFAQFKSVQDTILAIRSAAIPSEAEIRNIARISLDKARIRAVVLPAAMFVNQAQEFPEKEVADHFEKYRDRERGKGLEFGYRVPQSVRVQYLMIGRDAVAATIGVANLESKAKRFYDENRDKDLAFRRPDDSGTPPHEQPPEYLRAKSQYLDWDEAKDVAVQKVRTQQADETTARMADWLIQHLQEPWLESPRGEDGYKSVPAGVSDPEAFSRSLERLPATLAYRDAVTIETTEFFSRDKADSVAVISKVSHRPERGSPVALPALAFQTKGIVPKVPDTKGINPLDFLAPFQTCAYSMTDPEGNRYLFRVVESREARPPDLEDVHPQVVQDLRMLQALKVARNHAENLRACLDAETNLKQAFESDPELMAGMQSPEGKEAGAFEPQPFERMNVGMAARGKRNPTKFLPGNVGFVPTDVVDQIFQLDDAVEKFAVYDLPERAAILAVEWISLERATEDQFLAIREQIAGDLGRSRADAAALDWVNPEKIRARNQFEMINEKSR